ncbi:hypothetical protein [Brevundimonas sp.]|uniref:hypothetical protein n=1 Tax=Brevundimonas sp. TaxID=1871086 RepID=UPI00262BE97B|nr:hypothetical protein [Brevundimonas sp.]
MTASEITALATLFVPAAHWAMAPGLVAHAVQRRQAVIHRGPDHALLPDDPVTAKDPPVIGE